MNILLAKWISGCLRRGGCSGGVVGACGGGGEEGGWRLHLVVLLTVSGSEAHSQNTHGEQAE